VDLPHLSIPTEIRDAHNHHHCNLIIAIPSNKINAPRGWKEAIVDRNLCRMVSETIRIFSNDMLVWDQLCGDEEVLK
jgi:hypothetical protein